MTSEPQKIGPKPYTVPVFLKPESAGPRDWGEEIVLGIAKGKYGLKLLRMNAGSGGGLQKHHRKDEMTYILEGEYEFTFDPGDGTLVTKVLGPGDCVHIPPGAVHQGLAKTYCVIIEAGTTHFNDRIRVEEAYGLPKGDGLPTTSLEDVIVK